MKRLIVAGCGALLVAGIVGGMVLWRSSGVRVFNGHTMGESGNDFAKIEAKNNQIDLDKCDDIGRPEKRHFCDELVEITDDFEKAHSDQSYITFGRPSRRQSLTYGAADHIHAEFDENGRLVKLTVEHVGKQDERLYHERRGVYKAVLKDMTAQFGTPSSVQEPAEKHSHPTASWFISPHTEITFEGSDFGDGTVKYSYVERSPEAAKQAIEQAAITVFRQGGTVDAVTHLFEDVGLTANGCKQRANANDYRDCEFASKYNESISASFYQGQAQRMDLTFPAERLDKLVRAVSSVYGQPRLTDNGTDDKDLTTYDWGTLQNSISAGKVLDGIHGWASFTHTGELYTGDHPSEGAANPSAPMTTGSDQESQRLPAIIHDPRKKTDACEAIVDYATIYTVRDASGNNIGEVDTQGLGPGRQVMTALRSSSGKGDDWLEVLGIDDKELSRPPVVAIATAVAQRYGIRVVGKTDHSAWRRAWSEHGLPLDFIQPKAGHAWSECFPTFKGSSRSFEGTEKNGSLSAVGVFTDIHDVNVGVPCPEPVAQVPTIHQRGTPVIPTCDYVLGFNGLDGKTVLFLYRGTHPPNKDRQLCRVRYTPGQQYEVERGYTIDDILQTASQMPVLLSVEPISSEDYAAAANQFTGYERQQFLKIPIYTPQPTPSAMQAGGATR
jgi:hypothetical protein